MSTREAGRVVQRVFTGAAGAFGSDRSGFRGGSAVGARSDSSAIASTTGVEATERHEEWPDGDQALVNTLSGQSAYWLWSRLDVHLRDALREP